MVLITFVTINDVITARKVVCGWWWHDLYTAKPLYFGDLHHPLAIYIYMCISLSFMNCIVILESSFFFLFLLDIHSLESLIPLSMRDIDQQWFSGSIIGCPETTLLGCFLFPTCKSLESLIPLAMRDIDK